MKTLGSACLLIAWLAGCAVAPETTIDARSFEALRAQPDRLIVIAVSNVPELIGTRAGATPRAYGSAPHYSTSDSARAVVASLARDYGLREISAWPIRPLQLHCVVFEIPPLAARDEILAQLSQDRRIRIAQPLQVFGTLGSAYNDPYVDLQRGFARIDAADAHRQSRGDGVRVAIIDTGVDTAHPDLKGRMALQKNFVDGDARQFDLDRHGTEVAGVIAADANNQIGIVGVAPGVRIIALKACWQLQPHSDGAACNSFTLAEALAAAIEADAQVLNLSLGGPADPLLTQLVEHAVKRGIIVVGAVPPDGRMDGFPVDIDGVIAVDVAHENATEPQTRSATLHAPGSEVLTLMPGGHYDFASGSSLATAHVSGAIALLLARKASLQVGVVRELLDHHGSDDSINACMALVALTPGNTCGSAAAAPAESNAVTAATRAR